MTKVGGELIKEFTDGTKWDECEMGDLYHVIGTPPRKPMAMYGTDLHKPLMIREETGEAARYRYICLKKHGKKRHVKSKSKRSAFSVSLSEQESSGNLVVGVFGAVVVAAVCVIAVVTWKKMRCEEKMKSCEEEVEELKKIADSRQ